MSSLKVVCNYKFRIYPTKEQESKLLRWLETCRRIYNAALAQRKEAWEKEKRPVTRIEQQVWLKEAKKANPYFREVHSQVAQEVLFRAERAFNGFFRRLKNGEAPGYPRFKSRGRYKSITFTQFGDGKGASIQDGKLKLSKIGPVKIRLHREIPGTVKTVIIKRTEAGEWYAVFAVEVEVFPTARPGPAVGLDVGLEKFAVLSGGNAVENPRYLRKTEKKAQARPAQPIQKAKRLPQQGKGQTQVGKGARQSPQPAPGLPAQGIPQTGERLRADRRGGTERQRHGQEPPSGQEHIRRGLERVSGHALLQSGRGWQQGGQSKLLRHLAGMQSVRDARFQNPFRPGA